MLGFFLETTCPQLAMFLLGSYKRQAGIIIFFGWIGSCVQWECSVMCWKGTFDTAPVSALELRMPKT